MPGESLGIGEGDWISTDRQHGATPKPTARRSPAHSVVASYLIDSSAGSHNRSGLEVKGARNRMMKNIIVVAVVIVGGFIPAAQAKDVLVKELAIKPDACYRISFKATASAKGATWLLRISNQQGEYPHDGSHERDWQQIVPGKVAYTHSFRSSRKRPMNGATTKKGQLTATPISDMANSTPVAGARITTDACTVALTGRLS